MCLPGRRPVSRGRGTLAEERPDLLQQWDFDANTVKPDTVAACSHYKATWRCGKCCEHCGTPHSWRTAIDRRVSLGTNCPCCSGRKVCRCRSVAAQRPDLMQQWDWEANADADPERLGLASSAKVSWVCPAHGSWPAKIGERVRGTGCPACAIVAKHSPRSKRGLLKDEHPELIAQLHPTLNGEFADLAGTLTCGSRKRLYWLCTDSNNRPDGCQHDHIWQARVSSRCQNRQHFSAGCPFCAGKRVCPCNSLACKEPGVLQLWDYDKNVDFSPDQVGTASQRRAHWQHVCAITAQEHCWEAGIHSVLKAWRCGNRAPCPICNLQNKRGSKEAQVKQS